MRKYFNLQTNPWLIHALPLVILLTGIWAKSFPLGNAFYDDPFHHGELVASLPFVLMGDMKFFTLHGAMDWVPAWVSQQVWGDENHFLPTRIIHTSLGALANLFLYCVVALLTSQCRQYRAILLGVSAVFTVYLINVGTRDLFLILSIWLYFLSEKSSSQGGRSMLEIILGVSLAANLFWSFNRGIAGITGVGLALLVFVVTGRRYLLSITSFAISIFLLHWIGVLSFSNYLDNFEFLLKTSSQWSYGYTELRPVLLTILVAIPNGWTIYYLGKQLHQEIRVRWEETATLILLTVLTVLMFKIGISRADIWHIKITLWMPALVFLYLRERYAEKLSMPPSGIITISMAVLALMAASALMALLPLIRGVGGGEYWFFLCALVFAIYTMHAGYLKVTGATVLNTLAFVRFATILLLINMLAISSKFYQDGYFWMSQIYAPPTNRSLVSKSIQWVSDEIVISGSNCVFDLSNNGVINGVTKLPACTKYIYPVYANQRYEIDMLHQLREHLPPVIVFSATYWSFNIDNISMHDRFPALKDYLVKTYPYEKCNFGYCLRYINQSSEGGST